MAARASASVYLGPGVATTRTLVRSPDRNTGLGSEDSNPGLQDQNLACDAGYTTPQRSRSVNGRPALPVPVGPVGIVLRRADRVALAVLPHRAIVLRHLLLIDGGRGPAGVLGTVDQHGLRLLEALGLAATRLLDRDPGRIRRDARAVRILVVAGVLARLPADPRGLGGGLGLLLALELAVALHGRVPTAQHGTVKPAMPRRLRSPRHAPRAPSAAHARRARRDRAGEGAPRPSLALPHARRRPSRAHPPRAVALPSALVPAVRRLRGRSARTAAPPARRDLRRPARPRAVPCLAVAAPDDPDGALLPLGGLQRQPPRGRG